MNTNVTDIIEQTVAQTVGGLLIGGAIDGFFGVPATGITKENAVKEVAIVLIQMGALGVMTAVYYSFMARRGIDANGMMNIPFIISVIATQQGLFTRLQQVKTALLHMIRSTYLGGLPSSDNPALTGYQPVQRNPANVDVPVPEGHESMPAALDMM